MKDSILNKFVFTPLGKGIVVAVFEDGTVCVRFDHGGGAVLHESEIFLAERTVSVRSFAHSMPIAV